ncbi:V-type ATP synthase subunit D [Haloimpatiens massiliensis]|uniref:V-type ATP synthase subunit D n=1 Tax=Haloimpatiens massiliensis TaxID=1658110 RepID=UPI000C837AC6|nr:V-type ATP synthase subunit D [Haloimpatiens massiliensis]
MQQIAPTKSNLISAQNTLEFSRKGFQLLDQKRNVLIREMMSYISRAEKLQHRINSTFSEAYEALRQANITMGISSVSDISMAIPETEDYNIRFKSVMGVEVPHLNYEKKLIQPSYSFHRSNTAMDIAYKKFNEVKYLIYEMAEVENAVYRLAVEVKKTQKRANALENIQIPKLQERVKFISEVLEEKEREDFFRLKMVKKKKKKYKE